MFWLIIGALKIKVPHFDTLEDITNEAGFCPVALLSP